MSEELHKIIDVLRESNHEAVAHLQSHQVEMICKYWALADMGINMPKGGEEQEAGGTWHWNETTWEWEWTEHQAGEHQEGNEKQEGYQDEGWRWTYAEDRWEGEGGVEEQWAEGEENGHWLHEVWEANVGAESQGREHWKDDQRSRE